jgi:hypothetical protein
MTGWMSRISIDDPDMVAKKSVGSDARIYVGQDLAGEDVELVISRIDDSETDAETPEDADA